MDKIEIVKSTLDKEEKIIVERTQRDNSVYSNHIETEKKILRLNELTKDLAQVQAGLVIDDIEERKAEFRTLLNEVRELQGKEPRKTNN